MVPLGVIAMLVYLCILGWSYGIFPQSYKFLDHIIIVVFPNDLTP